MGNAMGDLNAIDQAASDGDEFRADLERWGDA